MSKSKLFPRSADALLTTPQVREVIAELEGDELPQRTLAGWQQQDIAVPSGRWDRVRGSAHPCLWTLDDLARVRLVVRLRRQGGLSMPRVRLALAKYERELREALRPDSPVVLIVDPRVGVVLRDEREDFHVERGERQYRLTLRTMYDDTARVIAKVLKAA